MCFPNYYTVFVYIFFHTIKLCHEWLYFRRMTLIECISFPYINAKQQLANKKKCCHNINTPL